MSSIAEVCSRLHDPNEWAKMKYKASGSLENDKP